jgi:hypothetical protein
MLRCVALGCFASSPLRRPREPLGPAFRALCHRSALLRRTDARYPVPRGRSSSAAYTFADFLRQSLLDCPSQA